MKTVYLVYPEKLGEIAPELYGHCAAGHSLAGRVFCRDLPLAGRHRQRPPGACGVVDLLGRTGRDERGRHA